MPVLECECECRRCRTCRGTEIDQDDVGRMAIDAVSAGSMLS
jgi:hypothetical protein